MRRALPTMAVSLALIACAERRPDVPAIAASASAPVPAAPTATATATADPPRLYVVARSLPIHADPSLKGRWIGTLAAGDSVDLRDEPPRTTPGCTSVRAVAPRGYACADATVATLSATDPVWLALRQHAPDFTSPWPYTYGESRGAHRHKSVPGIDDPGWPPSLLDPNAAIAKRSTVAWTDEAEGDGTSWLRTNDMSLVRKDRVTPFDRSDFHGVFLGGEVALPIAFFKHGPHAKYARDASGRLAATGETWPRLGWTALTGQTEKHGPHVLWETREAGTWIDARDAAVVAPDGTAPAGAPATWIEVAALQGWLVAYEGDHAVFATMISAGKLGAAKPDLDHEPPQPPATTPLGTFRIREKLLTATLQSDLDDGTEFVHAEVPWSQRFFDKYLLHTAYWHDQWGEGHSGGCVNLSPADAMWLFAWTTPKLPLGWHAVRANDTDDPASTVVVIHP